MMLSISRRSEYRVAVELFGNEGEVLFQNTLNRFKDKDLRWVANMCGCSLSEATQHLNTVCSTQVDEVYTALELEVHPPQAMIDTLTRKVEPAGERISEQGPFQVFVREIAQPVKFAETFADMEPGEALRAAFEGTKTGTEPLLEWSDKNLLCCLDIDYHNWPNAKRPSHRELKAIVSRLKPQPFCWHPSHRGGAKLYYSARPGYTGEELAAIGGISWQKQDPRATFDLIKATRHPCYIRTRDKAKAPLENPEQISYCYGAGDPAEIRRLLAAEMDATETAAFLAEKGWSIGQTLPHSVCPIDAGNSSDESKNSVFIGETGVFCHRCSGRGLGAGGSGFMPYTALAGGNDPRLAVMVKGFCHYEHAAVILTNLFPGVPSQVLEIVYRVMLKIVHTPDDPRIPLALSSGRGFVRGRGLWVTADGTSTLSQGLKEYIRSLPAVLTPGENGFGLNVAKYAAFLNSGSLEQYGYSDITFIRGVRVHGQHMPGREGENVRTIIRSEFRHCSPAYVPASKRMPSKEAWELLDDTYPGIDQNYVRLLIASKGASEGRLAQCPFLMITGPAGSGKSTTPHIAAGICGDKADEPVWHPHPERFRAALMDASRESSFVVINEIFKSADQARVTYVQALNPMLSLTEDSRSHVLYLGSVPFGRLPVFVLTDVNVPPTVENDIQIGRRFIYHRLSSKISWESTFVQRGIRAHEFRCLSHEHSSAADAILSEVIDQFFQEPMSLRDIASALGSQYLSAYSDDGNQKHSLMIAFYKEVVNAVPLTGSDAARYSPNTGWKRIDKTGQNTLNDLWCELCDGNTPERWQSSRTCDSEDWASVLGLNFPVICDLKAYQSSAVYVRFRSADDARKPHWINGREM